jgi:hypothetical protein
VTLPAGGARGTADDTLPAGLGQRPVLDHGIGRVRHAADVLPVIPRAVAVALIVHGSPCRSDGGGIVGSVAALGAAGASSVVALVVALVITALTPAALALTALTLAPVTLAAAVTGADITVAVTGIAAVTQTLAVTVAVAVADGVVRWPALPVAGRADRGSDEQCEDQHNEDWQTANDGTHVWYPP